ncbi:hypothetical protein [Streptomyces malaysiense]|uniref:Secreted protein n=1 Tax=Streptomyces malaysiense TaxID=1428626 RepID=A0A1J4PU53_9ACTN|nr:hypothetical protein [Streptomyces malaysiense]OIK24234.1 hypothetical protein VT52_028225 [Streptomyces malaysiense]
MRPFAAGAVALLAFSLAVPAAHASPRTDCDKALAVAQQAERYYDGLKADLLRSMASGGHPGTAQRQALQKAESVRNSTSTEAERVCAAGAS